MGGFKNWLRTHKPLNWKWYLIIFLLVQLFKKWIYFLLLFFIGIINYPNKIDYNSISERAGERIGEIYTDAMIRVYELGLNLGERLFPHNVLVGEIMYYIILIILIIVAVILLILILNSFLYKEETSKDKIEKGDE